MVTTNMYVLHKKAFVGETVKGYCFNGHFITENTSQKINVPITVEEY